MFPTTAKTPRAPGLGPRWLLAWRLWPKNPVRVDPGEIWLLTLTLASVRGQRSHHSNSCWFVRKLIPDIPGVCTLNHHMAPSRLGLEQLESNVYCSVSPDPESDPMTTPTPRFSTARSDRLPWLRSIASREGAKNTLKIAGGGHDHETLRPHVRTSHFDLTGSEIRLRLSALLLTLLTDRWRWANRRSAPS